MNPNRVGRPIVMVAIGVVGALAVRATAVDVVPGEGETPRHLAEEAAQRGTYTAHLAANDAAAERWHAEHGSGDATLDAATFDDHATPDNAGCPEGTQYWRRDRITELCAPLCTGDQDCGPEDGRCRLLDVEERDDAAPIVLVDDTPAEELEAVELDGTKQAPAVRVCDPFWDVEGALDADLVAVAE